MVSCVTWSETTHTVMPSEMGSCGVKKDLKACKVVVLSITARFAPMHKLANQTVINIGTQSILRCEHADAFNNVAPGRILDTCERRH